MSEPITWATVSAAQGLPLDLSAATLAEVVALFEVPEEMLVMSSYSETDAA